VKWKELEGVGPDGLTNWSLRWPVMCQLLRQAQFDLLCMQEVEHTDAEDISAGLGADYVTFYFKHKARPPDGLMIAVRSAAFAPEPIPAQLEHNGVAFGRVDVTHRASGQRVRILTIHARGGRTEQLEALAQFADDDGCDVDVTIIAGDFNEDFGAQSGYKEEAHCPFPEGRRGRYVTIARERDLPQVSRPPAKQAPEQKSGKGKIDYIWVRGGDSACPTILFRDEASRRAILESHAVCEATGHWPSDHGVEALSLRLLPPAQ